MALRTVTVKSAGGDYSDLNAAASGEEADLVALDRQLVIECYNFEDTGGRGYFNDANWTVDVTHYVTVTVPVGQRHDGKWSTSGYRLKITGGWASGINTELDYTRLEWLQVEDNMTVAGGSGFSITGENCVVDGCITKFTGVATTPRGFSVGPAANGTWLRNCLAHDYRNGSGGRGFSLSTDTSGELELDNCGAHNCYQGFVETWFPPILKNCWAQDCDDGFNGTWHADSDYNLSDLAADAPGTNSKNSTEIEFVDKADDDFHLADTDLGALNSGVDLSGTFTDDIDGDVRSGSWDIGPDQLTPFTYVGLEGKALDTITVGGGVRPRRWDMADSVVRLEVLDDSYESVEVLIDDAAYSFVDEDYVSWETIAGAPVTFAMGYGSIYIVRGTITTAAGDIYHVDAWLGLIEFALETELTVQESGVDQGEVTLGATVTVVGGATARRALGSTYDVLLKLQKWNGASWDDVSTLLDEAGAASAEDVQFTWQAMNTGTPVTVTPASVGIYRVYALLTDDNGETYPTYEVFEVLYPLPDVGNVTTDDEVGGVQGTFEEPGVANVKDGKWYGADGTELEGIYDPQASVSIPVIGSVTAVGTTITVPVTNVAGKTCFVWIKDTDGTEIDEQSRSGNGNVDLTIDTLGKTIIIEAATNDATRSAFSEPAAKRVYVASSGSANEVLAHVIDVLQANSTLVALLASSDDIRRGDQPIAKAFPQITMMLVDDPDLALDDTDDVRVVTLTGSAWGYVQDDLASILQQVDVSLYDNRGMESTSWLVTMSRRIGSQEPAPTGFIKDSDGRTLHQVVFTYQLRIVAK